MGSFDNISHEWLLENIPIDKIPKTRAAVPSPWPELGFDIISIYITYLAYYLKDNKQLAILILHKMIFLCNFICIKLYLCTF